MSKLTELHNPEEVWGQVKESRAALVVQMGDRRTDFYHSAGETQSAEIILQLKAINPYNKFIPVLTLLQYDIAEECYYFCPT